MLVKQNKELIQGFIDLADLQNILDEPIKNVYYQDSYIKINDKVV